LGDLSRLLGKYGTSTFSQGAAWGAGSSSRRGVRGVLELLWKKGLFFKEVGCRKRGRADANRRDLLQGGARPRKKSASRRSFFLTAAEDTGAFVEGDGYVCFRKQARLGAAVIGTVECLFFWGGGPKVALGEGSRFERRIVLLGGFQGPAGKGGSA